MKKVISILLVAFLILGIFVRCGESDSQTVSSNDDSVNPTNYTQDKENNLSGEQNGEIVTIDKTIVYDNNGIKVTVTGIEEGWTGTEIKFLVENSTDRNIALSGDVIVVNGITMPAYLYIDVAAGKKTNSTMSIYSANLDVAGVERIATISGKDARIVDTDSYETIAEAPFEIITSVGTDYIQQQDESGDIVFESNGITVIAKIISGSIFGKEVILLAKNESGNNVIIEAENISVNGFTVDGWMYDTVFAETVRFCELDIYSSSLEENGITQVEDVSFTINLIDAMSYNRIAKSNEIQIFVNP